MEAVATLEKGSAFLTQDEECESARLERLREGYKIVEEIRETLRARGVEDEMSMEEIDEEIASWRKEQQEFKVK